MRLWRSQRLKTLQHLASLMAVALLICSNMVHLHVRYCLDGGDPTFTVHVETESVHGDHADEDASADVESEFSIETLLSKVFDGSADFHVARSFSFSARNSTEPHFARWTYSAFVPDSPSDLFPPLRGPPALT